MAGPDLSLSFTVPTAPSLAPRTVPGPTAPTAGAGSMTSFNLEEEEKRWLVVGICLNKLLLPTLRQFVDEEIKKHYIYHKTSHNIHNQTFPRQLAKENASAAGFEFNYASVNNNFSNHKSKKKAYDYNVNSAVEFAKLYLLPQMAKFTGFDDTCDISAALGILAAASVFSPVIQTSAKDVRTNVRNEWGHCNFKKWDMSKFGKCFEIMETLVKNLKIKPADETLLVKNLKDWELKGHQLCMGNLVDAELMKLVAAEVKALSIAVDVTALSKQEDTALVAAEIEKIRLIIMEQNHRVGELSDTVSCLGKKVESVELKQDGLKDKILDVKEIQKNLQDKVSVVGTEQLSLKTRVDSVENKQLTLEKKFDDIEQSLRKEAGLSSSTSKFHVPNRVRYFCGRAEELDFLAKVIEMDERACIFSVISGLGGTGKTSLALEHVWSNKENYDGGVFWISGESQQQFQITLTEMARSVRKLAEDLSQTLSNTLAWLQTREQYWCLVVDNLDELELSDDMLKLLNGQWKRMAKGHVIITTRREKSRISEEIQEINDNRCLELACLTASDSVSFLKNRTGRTENNAEEEVAMSDLAQELGHLPLALDQAGAYVHRRQCTFLSYWKEFQKKKLKLLNQKSWWTGSGLRSSVQTTWQINFDYVVELSKEMGLGRSASLVMEISAFLSPDDIPREIINQGLPLVMDENLRECAASAIGVADLLTVLTDFSLFQRFTECSYSVHRVVQKVIRSRIDKDRMVEILGSATRMLNFAFSNSRTPFDVCKNFEGGAVFNQKNLPSLKLWSKLSAHACTLQDHLLQFTEEHRSLNEVLLCTQEAVRLLNEASVFLSASREKVRAQEFHLRKLELIVKLLNPPAEKELEYFKFFEIPLKYLHYKLISHCMATVETDNERESRGIRGNRNAVDALREEGNDAVREKKFQLAVKCYTDGISLGATDYRLFANRALCYLKLSKPSKALEDCERCLKLESNYSKAVLRKAWALHELASENPHDKHLQSRSFAAAALAKYIDPVAGNDKQFKKMFPQVLFKEVRNPLMLTSVLLLGIPGVTLLLHDGDYELQEAVVTTDTQVVGIGSEVTLKIDSACNIMKASCCFENVSVVIGSGAIVCRIDGVLTLLGCNISAGSLGCEDFPDCNGGPGCIAGRYVGKNPCNREGAFGDTFKGVSGLVGIPGIQIVLRSSGYIKDCDIHHCGGGGILCDGEGSTMTVTSCRIHDNYLAGLTVRSGAFLGAEDCDIFANKFCGIMIKRSGKPCDITENRIFENWNDGILIKESSNHKTTITRNSIYHNHSFGISLEHSSVQITHNKIFENGFFAIGANFKTTAYIAENTIHSNKCGGIMIGVNYSGRVIIYSNIVRDHSGPWLLASRCDVTETDPALIASTTYLPPGETKFYTTSPITKDNKLSKNEEGMFHPKQRTCSSVQQCAFCNQPLKLHRRCASCNIAEYCNRRCQELHLQKHEVVCKSMTGRYSVTLSPLSLFRNFSSSNYVLQIQAFGSHLKGIGTGPKPDPRCRKAFIVKVQTGHLNSHPRQMLTVYDKSLTIDGKFESPEIFHVIMECGVLGELDKFTSKKVFLWAKFADSQGKLTIFLDKLAPYQEW